MYHFNLQPSEVLFHLFLKYHTPSPPPCSYLYFVRIKAEGGEGGHVLIIVTRPLFRARCVGIRTRAAAQVNRCWTFLCLRRCDRPHTGSV